MMKTLFFFSKQKTNKDLRRTGQQIVMLTAGNGLFEVDKNFARMTKKRVLDGIGCDVVSLAKQPIHATPVSTFHSFLFVLFGYNFAWKKVVYYQGRER